jgi:hypothetical protein
MTMDGPAKKSAGDVPDGISALFDAKSFPRGRATQSFDTKAISHPHRKALP